jgi:hypothetical protein
MFNDSFEAFVELTTWQQNFALAALAHQANIRSQPDYFPFVTAARMRLTQPHDIT